MDNPSPSPRKRGGPNRNQGRKPSGRRPYTTRLTPSHIEWIKTNTPPGKDECRTVEMAIELARKKNL